MFSNEEFRSKTTKQPKSSFRENQRKSLEPHYTNFRVIIDAKSVFSSARIIREREFAISINYKNSIFIKIIKYKHKPEV